MSPPKTRGPQKTGPQKTGPQKTGPLRTLTGQITVLVLGAVLIGAVLVGGVLLSVARTSKMGMTPELKAAAEAARFATVTEQARAATTPEDLKSIIANSQAPGEHIVAVDLPATVRTLPLGEGGALPDRIRSELAQHWQMSSLDPLSAGTDPDAIVVALNPRQGLAFTVNTHSAAQTLILVQAGFVLPIILLLVLALSIYAVHRITRPLTAFAAAAEAFGRTPHQGDPLAVTGPLEVARVAHALNEMRDRVQKLVDERTRMLAAISHDLRTPLTRLHLRSERVDDGQDRQGMLDDIRMIDGMLAETLTYLRDGRSGEGLTLIDLPSFLQTICDEYVDTGHPVTYHGPARFAFRCRPLALKRAVSNVIDNGVRFSSEVTVTLNVHSPVSTTIEIADDGPGIPADLKGRVFEPFFKVDEARTSDGKGFGLGLAITRDIIERDGGQIMLGDRRPTGLVVSLKLKRIDA